MKRIFYILIACAAVVSCGGARQKSTKTTPVVRAQVAEVEVVNVYPHQRDAYTQGLQFIDGVMWEGTGNYGGSRLQYTDLVTGKSTVVANLPNDHFGEGITLLGDKIYQLTWQNGVMHIYDRKSLKKIDERKYKGEGWGLTTDGQSLYMSDGTPDIRVLDPQSLALKRRIAVTCNGESLPYLNELEWIEGKIWANVYTLDQIVIINPDSGVVEKIVNLSGLLPQSEYTETTDVLNGIAYDEATKRIFVTGKNWSKMFEIRLL
ncbi:MAG: glutaminyl-peptide cyclotransferase [Rikenellaceae bacterium]|nr:glutaminyl-peptide cyclotransferase [Rikenellaceae bacterium]